MKRVIMRGQMYLASLDPIKGSEQGGTRPVVVLQNDTGNRHSTTMIVAPVTGRVKKLDMPTHVDIPPRFGLPCRSMVMLEQLRTIDEVRLGDYLGFLTGDVMDKIDDALEISVGLRPIVPNQLKKDEAEDMFLCLCPVCAQQFFTSPDHIIRRADPLQVEKSACDYCRTRRGFDYQITAKGGDRR